MRAALFPCAKSRGSVVLSPGRTEPIEKYYEVIDELRGRGFTVLVHDWRGQGLSDRLLKDRRKGHAKGSQAFLSDFSTVLNTYEDRLPKPWVAVSHSMGAGLTALALIKGEKRFSAAVLSAAMLGVNLRGYSPKTAGRIAAVVGKLGLAGQYIPAWSDPLEIPFQLGLLTHDEQRWNRYRDQMLAYPDLRLGGATWGWLQFALKLSADVQAPGAVEGIATPMLVVLAEEEALIDNSLIRAFAARAPDATLLELKGARHELFMETDQVRDQLWTAFDALLKRTGI